MINILPEIQAIVEKAGENFENIISIDIETVDVSMMKILITKRIYAKVTDPGDGDSDD